MEGRRGGGALYVVRLACVSRLARLSPFLLPREWNTGDGDGDMGTGQDQDGAIGPFM